MGMAKTRTIFTISSQFDAYQIQKNSTLLLY